MEAKEALNSLPVGCKLKKNEGKVLEKLEQFRRIVGRLMYLTVTRPDLTFVVQHLSQFMGSPTDRHMKISFESSKLLEGNLLSKVEV